MLINTWNTCHRKVTWLVVLLVFVMLFGSITAHPINAENYGKRLAGEDCYKTAISISQEDSRNQSTENFF